MGGGGGGSKPQQSAPPPQAQPIDYGALMASSSKAASKQFRDQLAALIEAYPKQEALQLGTLRKIADNLDNEYTQQADTALGAAAQETGKLTAAGDRIGTTATRADELAANAQAFANGPTALDRQIGTLGASAMSQRADQVNGATVQRADRLQSAQVGPMADAAGATSAAAQMAYVPRVDAQQISSQQAGDFERVSAQQARAASAGPVERVAGTTVRQVGPMQSARVARTADVASRDIRQNAAEAALMREAAGGGLLGQLEGQARNDLALGRSLSAEQSRDAQQSARAAYSARGLGASQGAMAAEILNRDRYASQRENERRAFASGVLNQGTGVRQAANQASMSRQDANAARSLQAGLANQSVAANRASQNAQLQQQTFLTNNQNEQARAMADAGYAQQAGLANQDIAFRAASQDAQLAQQTALANQDASLRAAQLNQAAGLQNNQFNANMRQAALLSNQETALRAALANQQSDINTGQFNAANQQNALLQNAQFAQQAGLQNQQTALQLGLTNAQLQQQGYLTDNSNDQSRYMADAGYAQQAALANQDANQRQVEMNRAFLQNANQSGINSEISRGGYAMGALGQTANLYGQQAGAYQNAAGLGLSIANQSMANDPYMRAFAPGTSIGGGTLGTSANMIGNTWNGATQMAGNVASFNANMLDSRYNTYMNNQAALQGASMQAGATAGASRNAMMGQGMQAGGMAIGLGMTALAI